MAVTYIHTCYWVLDPKRSEDFYVNKLGMKKAGELNLGSATNHFFAFEADPSQPMLELTHNHDRTEPYDKGDGYAHVRPFLPLRALKKTRAGSQKHSYRRFPSCST